MKIQILSCGSTDFFFFLFRSHQKPKSWHFFSHQVNVERKEFFCYCCFFFCFFCQLTFITLIFCLLETWYLSVQFSHSVVSDSLRPHKLQHTRPPCPSPTPGVHQNSGPSSLSIYIESVMPSSHLLLCRHFPSCPQSLPASESFPMS